MAQHHIATFHPKMINSHSPFLGREWWTTKFVPPGAHVDREGRAVCIYHPGLDKLVFQNDEGHDLEADFYGEKKIVALAGTIFNEQGLEVINPVLIDVKPLIEADDLHPTRRGILPKGHRLLGDGPDTGPAPVNPAPAPPSFT